MASSEKFFIALCWQSKKLLITVSQWSVPTLNAIFSKLTKCGLVHFTSKGHIFILNFEDPSLWSSAVILYIQNHLIGRLIYDSSLCIFVHVSLFTTCYYFMPFSIFFWQITHLSWLDIKQTNKIHKWQKCIYIIQSLKIICIKYPLH